MITVDKTLLLQKIRELSARKPHLLIAIDGRCAAGKTTLATYLRQTLSGNVIHMDDFFLRPEQRTPERMKEPGGNVDYERFLQEVLIPLRQGQPFLYRAYDCHMQAMAYEITVEPLAVNIIEGAYACHPVLRDYYHYRVFLTINPDEQYQRIITRNGKQDAVQFKDKWIPLEEQYFLFHKVSEYCDAIYESERSGR